MFSKKLLFNSTILSIPGLISIFISLLAIPIHLKIAGIEKIPSMKNCGAVIGSAYLQRC